MIKSYKVIATQIERGYVVTSKRWGALYFFKKWVALYFWLRRAEIEIVE
jgi:hypothetical protein